MKGNRNKPTNKHKSISYAKWGYIFILPFFVVYLLCKFVPQVLTIYNSFFVNYRDGLMQVGPKFAGFNNFVSLFTPDKTGTIAILKYFLNTIVLWLMGAIPQIVIALFLAVTLSSNRLNLKGQKFFKTVIYMPNLIMASAFAMLVFALFSNVGPINQLLKIIGGENAGFDFMSTTLSVRSQVAGMNFIMWFGNTTIVLLAGILGIDQSLFEAASVDGATGWKTFLHVTIPCLAPMLVYVIITAMIGGLQMFDVPQVLTNAKGMPDRTSFTMVMQLNSYLGTSRNFGMAGAVSVILFIVSAVLSLNVYRSLSKQYRK